MYVYSTKYGRRASMFSCALMAHMATVQGGTPVLMAVEGVQRGACQREALAWPLLAVVIEQGKPELNQCMISCPGGGLEARAGANPTLVDCTIQDCAYGTGIALDQCKGLIKTCAVTRCKIGMEIVGMESGVFMDHCSSTHNRGAGVVIEHGAAPKLQWCRFSHNKTHGVLVEDKASPILLHCVMGHNERHGLAVEASEVRRPRGIGACAGPRQSTWGAVWVWSAP